MTTPLHHAGRKLAGLALLAAFASAMSATLPARAREFGVTLVIVAPKLHGIAAIASPADTRAETGTITFERGTTTREASLDEAGHFAVGLLAPGRYRTTIATLGSTCSTTVAIPPVSSMDTDLGTIVCTPSGTHSFNFSNRPRAGEPIIAMLGGKASPRPAAREASARGQRRFV